MSGGPVLFVAPAAYTLGGLATWLDYLIPGLRQRGEDVRLALVSGPRYHDPRRYAAAHPGLAPVVIHSSLGTRVDRVRAVESCLRRHSPELVLSVNIPDALLAVDRYRRSSAGRNCRAVMTCHGIQEDLFVDMQVLREHLDGVVCTNRLACRLASDAAGVSVDRIHYAAYGTESVADDERRTGDFRFRIGYAGRLEEDQKQVSMLSAVARRLADAGDDWELLIAGDGPDESSVREELRAQGLSAHVRFLGHVPADRMADEFYTQIDALLMPSRWETGPIVIWEALAHGVPVVSSRYVGSGLEGALINGVNSLRFDIGDAETATAALLRLRDDEELRETLVLAGHELIRTRYSREASVACWSEVLRDILDRDAIHPAEPPPIPVPRGRSRLERVVPGRLADVVRRALQRTGPDVGPGGEWPHSLSAQSEGIADFEARAARLDCSAEVHSAGPAVALGEAAS